MLAALRLARCEGVGQHAVLGGRRVIVLDDSGPRQRRRKRASRQLASREIL